MSAKWKAALVGAVGILGFLSLVALVFTVLALMLPSAGCAGLG